MNRSFRQRVGALAGVLLAGTVVLAWASPASAQPAPLATSTATLGTGPGAITVGCGPGTDAATQTGSDTVEPGGGTVEGTAKCGTNTTVSSAAQVTGTYDGNTFTVQCSYANANGSTVLLYQETVNGVTTNFVGVGQGSLEIGGVTVASVNCLQPYPLAVGVGGAADAAGPALVTQPSASDDGSGRGTTWLLLAGAAALLVVAGQLAMGRRIGRHRS